MVEVAADGINYDTVASTGDAEFLAALRACEHISNETDMAVEIGMAAEMVLGFHGELEYDGMRLAGLWPHQQMKLCREGRAPPSSARSSTTTRGSRVPGTSPGL